MYLPSLNFETFSFCRSLETGTLKGKVRNSERQQVVPAPHS